MMKAIACMTLCNSLSLVVYEIEYGVTDRLLAGFNDDTPEWYNVHYDSDDTYIEIASARYSLNEMLRCFQ